MSRYRLVPTLTALCAVAFLVGARLAAGDVASTGALRLGAAPNGIGDTQPEPPSPTNFPVPPRSARGTNCPMAEIPGYPDSLFDPETGRMELSFYDVAFEASRSIVLHVEDPACYEHQATRGAMFHLLITTLDTTGSFEAACDRLRVAIRAGFLKLGERPLDLTPARPYLNEVCRTA